jgi:two-component system alkaline phosphatase synthesis response regulator PhoP
MTLIYCVEDDESIRELVVYALKSAGFEVRGFEKPLEFWPAMNEKAADLLLLDIMLPDEDGYAILAKLKAKTVWQNIPVIMLTAKTMEYDKVKGLDMGADDYITKPFGIMELISRIKAVLRRTTKINAEVYSFEGIVLDTLAHKVTVNGKECQLTLKEFELLHYLLENTGVVLSRDQIMDKVWGFDFGGESRTVDMHIKTLRQKLGQGGKLIQTIRGIGYKIGG